MRDTKSRVSPIPNRGLEIPITLIAEKGTSTIVIFCCEDMFRRSYIQLDRIVKREDRDEYELTDDKFFSAEKDASYQAEQTREEEHTKEERLQNTKDIVIIHE